MTGIYQSIQNLIPAPSLPISHLVTSSSSSEDVVVVLVGVGVGEDESLLGCDYHRVSRRESRQVS